MASLTRPPPEINRASRITLLATCDHRWRLRCFCTKFFRCDRTVVLHTTGDVTIVHVGARWVHSGTDWKNRSSDMNKILLQTTIAYAKDNWSIARFSTLADILSAVRDESGTKLFHITARD